MAKVNSYAAAGVDIEAADAVKQRMKPIVRSTFRPEVLSDVGGFGGLFALRWRDYQEPILVSSVDSVGTKLKVAFMTGRHNTVGIDLVSHCVNDILVQGAEPLFFMDYLAMGKLDPDVVIRVVEGVAEGCRRVKCALLKGETAELPDFYQEGEYDLAGTIVGVVERGGIVDGSRIQPGDKIIGLASDGLHTNGYSLARKLIFEVAGLGADSFVEQLGTTVGEELLRPHRCYVKPVLELLQSADVHGMAHITGGGFQGNIPRVLPDGTSARIDLGSWDIPPIFPFLQGLGGIPLEEMYHTFNMGVGMMLMVAADDAEEVRSLLERRGERAYMLGEIVEGDVGVKFVTR